VSLFLKIIGYAGMLYSFLKIIFYILYINVIYSILYKKITLIMNEAWKKYSAI